MTYVFSIVALKTQLPCHRGAPVTRKGKIMKNLAILVSV